MVAALQFTPAGLFTLVRFHPAPLLVVLGGVAAYTHGVRRYERSGRRWPRARVASFAVAAAVVVVATLSGLASFAGTDFAVYAVAQLGLFLLAPPFLVLAAPLTLAIETAPPARAARLRRWATGPLARVIGHPVSAWAIYGAALFALYFTSQYRLGVEHGWALQLTSLELLAVGTLYAGVVMGADPKPHRLAVGWRILYLMLGTVFYSVLGMAMESQRHPLAPGLSVSGLHTGAGDIWTAAEIFAIVATVGVLYQWLMADEGHARRADRYNAEEDARQLAAWRAVRREAALADIRASESVIVRSRPAGTDRSDRSFLLTRSSPAAAGSGDDHVGRTGPAEGGDPGRQRAGGDPGAASAPTGDAPPR